MGVYGYAAKKLPKYSFLMQVIAVNLFCVDLLEGEVRSKTHREVNFIAEIRLDIDQKGYKVRIAVSQLIALLQLLAVT
jgi:hypothetical protein